MADTIVTTPQSDSSGAAGWVLAIVVVVAVLLGAFWFARNGAPTVPNTGTDINVTVPSGGGTGTGGSGTGTGTGTTY